MPPLTHSVAMPRFGSPQHFVQQRHRDARPGAADGMAERDGAAVDVEALAIEMEFAIAGQHLGGKGFVELDEIEIAVQTRTFLAACESPAPARCP